MSTKKSDLFNNPMLESAKRAMGPEQIAEYKKVGEYMYNSENYKIKELGSKVEQSTDIDLVSYATQSLKSGLDPYDLSEKEIQALVDTYGDEWYTRFDLEKDDVPEPMAKLVKRG